MKYCMLRLVPIDVRQLVDPRHIPTLHVKFSKVTCIIFAVPSCKTNRIQLHPHARQRRHPLQPSFTPSNHPCGSGVHSSPTPQQRPSLPACCLKTSLSPPQFGRRSPSPRPPLCPLLPRRANHSPASPVAEGLDLYPPCPKHICRVATIKTVCAWKLPG